MRGIRGALLLGVFAAACGGGGTEPAANGNTGGTGGTGGSNDPVSTTSVTVEDNMFTPKNIAVAVGATVTWTWSATQNHDVTFGSGGSSGAPKSSGTFSRSFPNAGTFTYNCTQHSGMTGSVLVQ